MRCFVIALICFPIFLVGCSGNIECNFVTTNFNSINVEPTDAKVFRFKCDECFWWLDESGRLNIAGKGINKSLINSTLDREFYISFVLGSPSHGIGKNYKLNSQSIRGLIKMSGNMYRFRSVYGILGIENRKQDLIKGAYRANVRVCAARLLGGWSKSTPFLICGTLQAVPDKENKGKQIRKITEQMGYSRRFTNTSPK